MIKDPLNVRPIAHAIWDPHFGKAAVDAFTLRRNLSGHIAYSGAHHWWYTHRYARTNNDLYMSCCCWRRYFVRRRLAAPGSPVLA